MKFPPRFFPLHVVQIEENSILEGETTCVHNGIFRHGFPGNVFNKSKGNKGSKQQQVLCYICPKVWPEQTTNWFWVKLKPSFKVWSSGFMEGLIEFNVQVWSSSKFVIHIWVQSNTNSGGKWESIEFIMGLKHAQYCFIAIGHAQCVPLYELWFWRTKKGVSSSFFWWQKRRLYSSSNSEKSAPSAQVFLLHFSSFVNCVTFQLQRKKCHHPIHTYCEELKSRLFRFGTIFSHWA